MWARMVKDLELSISNKTSKFGVRPLMTSYQEHKKFPDS